jgi:endonuclease VIII
LPEGDTIHRAAQTLHRALAGRIVTRFESVWPALNRVDVDRPLAGRTIDAVTAHGKHLLMAFSGGLVLRTHMRMNGSWHLYRPGERWQRPRRDMRLLVETDAFVAVAFTVPVAEFVNAADLARHKELSALGPDLAGANFDAIEALRRIRARPTDTIEDVLLNQHVMAGLGNVFKSEVLFVSGVDPWTRVANLSDDELARIVSTARKLMALNVRDRTKTLNLGGGRRTTRSMDPRATLWVYGRGRKPCRRCGTPIRVQKSGPDARLTYFCPRCQGRIDPTR